MTHWDNNIHDARKELEALTEPLIGHANEIKFPDAIQKLIQASYIAGAKDTRPIEEIAPEEKGEDKKVTVDTRRVILRIDRLYTQTVDLTRPDRPMRRCKPISGSTKLNWWESQDGKHIWKQDALLTYPNNYVWVIDTTIYGEAIAVHFSPMLCERREENDA